MKKIGFYSLKGYGDLIVFFYFFNHLSSKYKIIIYTCLHEDIIKFLDKENKIEYVKVNRLLLPFFNYKKYGLPLFLLSSILNIIYLLIVSRKNIKFIIPHEIRGTSHIKAQLQRLILRNESGAATNNIYTTYEKILSTGHIKKFDRPKKTRCKNDIFNNNHIIIFPCGSTASRKLNNIVLSRLINFLNEKNYTCSLLIHASDIGFFANKIEFQKYLVVYNNFKDLDYFLNNSCGVISVDTFIIHLCQYLELPHYIIFEPGNNKYFLTPYSATCNSFAQLSDIESVDLNFEKSLSEWIELLK